MNFELDESQARLYEDTLAFAREAITRDMVTADERSEFFEDGWRKCADHGILASVIPREYGGRGYGALECCLMTEALGRGCADLGLVFAIGAHLFACAVPISRFGSPEQKLAYLPRMAVGELIASHAATEPEAGSDLTSLTTRAERVDGSYAITGRKRHAANAPVARLFLVYATTRPDAGWLGLTTFLLERDTPGLSVSEPYRKHGLRTAPACDVFLDDCRIAHSARLGQEGHGGAILAHSMNWERTCLLAAWAGLLGRQVDEAIAFAKCRRQFGKAIKEFQAVSHRIADMKVRLDIARLLLWKSACSLDRHPTQAFSSEAATAKLYVSEAAVQSSLDLIQIFGGVGLLAENHVERYLRDSVPSRIFSGTSEMMRNTIVRNLGL
jgi:alkylation response protein AidB-like acyl-CoA dehydrogenase